MSLIVPRTQTEPEPVETGQGTFLVDPEGNVLERVGCQGCDDGCAFCAEPCAGCGDPDCDFDCDGDYDAPDDDLGAEHLRTYLVEDSRGTQTVAFYQDDTWWEGHYDPTSTKVQLKYAPIKIVARGAEHDG